MNMFVFVESRGVVANLIQMTEAGSSYERRKKELNDSSTVTVDLS